MSGLDREVHDGREDSSMFNARDGIEMENGLAPCFKECFFRLWSSFYDSLRYTIATIHCTLVTLWHSHPCLNNPHPFSQTSSN